MRAGQRLHIHYAADEWHSRILLAESSEKEVREMLRQDLKCKCAWWVLTPTGDIFPEPIENTSEIQVRMVDEFGKVERRGLPRGFKASDVIFDFDEVSVLTFADALEEVAKQRAAAEGKTKKGGGGDSELPKAPRNRMWIVVSNSEAFPAGTEVDFEVKDVTRIEDVAIGNSGGEILAFQALTQTQRDELATPKSDEKVEAKQEEEADLRVLPVQWKGGCRKRGFEEALELMEHVDFGDNTLEGEPVCEYYLQKIAGTGMAPTSRHRAWVSDSNIPAGDRSVHEHHMIMKVIEAAATKDQLNLYVLDCFELLCRRAQVIEQAHATNPSNPDYAHAEDFMGWGIQRGGAIVAPSLTRHAANKAGERSNIMKEQRKLLEELRLRRPPKGPKGKGKGQAEAGGDGS